MKKIGWFLLVIGMFSLIAISCAPRGGDDDDDDDNNTGIGVTAEQLAPFTGFYQFRLDAAENAEVLEEAGGDAASVTTIFDLETDGEIFLFQVGTDQTCSFVEESATFSISEDNQVLNITVGEASLQMTLSEDNATMTLTPTSEEGGHEHEDGGEGESILLDPFGFDEASVWSRQDDLPEACEAVHDHDEGE